MCVLINCYKFYILVEILFFGVMFSIFEEFFDFILEIEFL